MTTQSPYKPTVRTTRSACRPMPLLRSRLARAVGSGLGPFVAAHRRAGCIPGARWVGPLRPAKRHQGPPPSGRRLPDAAHDGPGNPTPPSATPATESPTPHAADGATTTAAAPGLSPSRPRVALGVVRHWSVSIGLTCLPISLIIWSVARGRETGAETNDPRR